MNGHQMRIPREIHEVIVTQLMHLPQQNQTTLDRESMRRLLNNTVESENDSEQCPICLENFEEGMTIVETQCNHKFHNACISRWLQNNTSCPVCRESFLEQRGTNKIKFVFPNNFELHTEWNPISNTIIDIFFFLSHFPTTVSHNYIEIQLGTRIFKNNEPYNSLTKFLSELDLVESIICNVQYRT
tara:strand:+ start:9478 stop:10035 length:558 start_codon:yes stop_codon:yes gene_type:complete